MLLNPGKKNRSVKKQTASQPPHIEERKIENEELARLLRANLQDKQSERTYKKEIIMRALNLFGASMITSFIFLGIAMLTDSDSESASTVATTAIATASSLTTGVVGYALGASSSSKSDE